ncbi:MAG TPA: amidase [Terriglobales bacterium]|nr:amidase [Terriglobales bacterium]
MRTIAEVSELIRKRELSSVDLVRECLSAIERLNPTLNAFITVTADSALAQAEEAEREIASGSWRGPLHGIPIGLKDLIDTAGVRTTAASAIFLDRVPTEDAEVVTKLKAAGAVLIGKQNLHEFAYGGSSVISHFGPVRNPINPDVIAGGSSGGSAAAVATGMCYAAIGTDTAGSIREPAALGGIVGVKPSYGLVSTRGIIPLSESLDHVGPMTRTVEDAAIVLDAIQDHELSSSYRKNLSNDIRDLSVGVPREIFFDDLDSDVAAAVENAVDWFAAQVKNLRKVNLGVDADRTAQKFEAYAYHCEMVTRSPELYHPETLRRIRTGEEITYAQYQAARRELEKMRKEIGAAFADVDIMLTPTTPIPAPRINDLLEDISRLRPAELVLLRNTRPLNVWGLPAISIPCGVTSKGLPIGLQIIGRPMGDDIVLRAAHAYEQRIPS